MLSNIGLLKSFWAETLVYACNLINMLTSFAIGGKALLKVWPGKVTQDYDSFQIFDCPTYYRIKTSWVRYREKVCSWVSKKGMKDYKI